MLKKFAFFEENFPNPEVADLTQSKEAL